MVPPGRLGVAAGAPVPGGVLVAIDAETREVADGVLFGGSPARLLRLSAAGAAALAELRDGPVRSAAAGVLARRLTDAGMAHPRPGPGRRLDVTIVVPARDRPGLLDRCLAAAGPDHAVLVVDDGSADPGTVAAVGAAHGARVLRRDVNGGPGAARNTALGLIETEFVAFLDSDCVPPPGWIEGLAGHFADPLVAAVAPRVVALAGSARAGSARAGSALDLGERPAGVAPVTRVAYVPTAALVARRAALGDGFDPALRYGEDVDLVWRLTEAGWRVRYEPGVQVGHAEPVTRAALLRRRFAYGTSAAPLTRRHPGAVPPLILQPWPAVTVAALLARRPAVAAAAFGASTLLLGARLRRSGLPARGLVKPMAGGVWHTWLGTGRWCGQFAGPALVLAAARPGGRTARVRWGRRLAAASLLAGPPLADWARRRDGDPVRFTAAALADQAAYGAGVYAGCLRERMVTPVLPVISWRPVAGLRRRGEPAGRRRSGGQQVVEQQGGVQRAGQRTPAGPGQGG